MPKSSEVPEKLRPYHFHRVELNWEGSSEPKGNCPFCRGDKFFVSRETGQYSCKAGHCQASGNAYTFIRKLHEESLAGVDPGYEEVADERRINVETLKAWGL